MPSKFAFYSFFSFCNFCSREASVSKTIPNAAVFSPSGVRSVLRSYLSLSLSLSPTCSPLLFQTHTNTRAHARYYTHLNGRTPLVLYRLLLVRADEMKEQLASIASSNRSSLAGRQNDSTAAHRRRFSGSPGAMLRAPRALRHPPLLSP